MTSSKQPRVFAEIAKRLGVPEKDVIFKGFDGRDRMVFICPDPDDFRWRNLPKDLLKRVPETDFNICITITLSGVSLPPAICTTLEAERDALIEALNEAVTDGDWSRVIEISEDLRTVEARLELCKPKRRTITACVFPRF